MNSTLTMPGAAARTRRRYIYPPRAVAAIPRDDLAVLARRGWLAQLKFNDTHILLDYDGPDFVKAWDRHAGTPSYDFEVLRDDLDALGYKLATMLGGENGGSGRFLLDGGLLHSKHAAIKHTLVIWDVLVKDGVHQLGTTYLERWQDLKRLCGADAYVFKCCCNPKNSREFSRTPRNSQEFSLGTKITPHSFCPDNYYALTGEPERLLAEWDAAWAAVEQVNADYDQPLLEGLMLKDGQGRLKQGLAERNNADWLCRSRVTTRRHLF